MLQINLLPWRAQKREQEKKGFIKLLIACASFGFIVVLVVNYHSSKLLNKQITRNQYFLKKLHFLDGQIKKIEVLKQSNLKLLSRMSKVKSLQSSKTLMINLLQELAQLIPQGIYLGSLERKAQKVTLHGKFQSNVDISTLMKNIEKNTWMYDPVLMEIKKTKTSPFASHQFTLSFSIMLPKEPPSFSLLPIHEKKVPAGRMRSCLGAQCVGSQDYNSNL